MKTGPGVPNLSTARALAIASQFGVTLAVAVLLGFVVGQWLDDRLGTVPIFSLAGVFAGLLAAISSAVTLFRATLRRSARAPQPLLADAEGDSIGDPRP